MVVPPVFQEEPLFPGGWGALLHPVFQEELPADVLEEYLDPA